MLSLGAGARRVFWQLELPIFARDSMGSTDWFAAAGGGSYERAAFRFLQRGTHTDKGALFRRQWSLALREAAGRGRFDWPREGVAKVAISATEFAALMDGLELTRTRAKLWWRKSGTGRRKLLLSIMLIANS